MAPATLAVRLSRGGRMQYSTNASGWRGVAALVAGEILIARHSGGWLRFKVCPYHACGVAFYDDTRNNSRVWHDVRICGNRTNLAAARQRRNGWRNQPGQVGCDLAEMWIGNPPLVATGPSWSHWRSASLETTTRTDAGSAGLPDH
jgi:hypothetical protein